MKAIVVKAHEKLERKVGEEVEITPEIFAPLYEAGFVLTASEWQLKQDAIKATEKRVDDAISASKHFAPKQDTAKFREDALAMEAVKAGSGVSYIASLPAKADAGLSNRLTKPGDAPNSGLEVSAKRSMKDELDGYIRASEPTSKQRRQGGALTWAQGDAIRTRDITAKAAERSIFLEGLLDKIRAGGMDEFQNVIKAADYVDPGANNPLGTLNTDLLIQANLGFLENMLVMFDDITTDFTNYPVRFNQTAVTRYIKVPGFQLKATGTAWRTTSGNTVDVQVKMDKFPGIALGWDNNYLASTTRNLPAEFRDPQLYGLAEAMIYYLINTAINGSTRIANDGSTSTTQKLAGLPDGVTANPILVNLGGPSGPLGFFTGALPQAMDLAKMPGSDLTIAQDPMRFCWLNTLLYRQVTQNVDFLKIQMLGAIAGNNAKSQNGALLATGNYDRIGNIRFHQSQLMQDGISLSSDGGSPAIYTVATAAPSAATTVGIAGTRSSLIFVARVPEDYTKATGAPVTAAVEVYTGAKTGIPIVVFQYLDNAYQTANVIAASMIGTSIGDERQGFLLNQK